MIRVAVRRENGKAYPVERDVFAGVDDDLGVFAGDDDGAGCGIAKDVDVGQIREERRGDRRGDGESAADIEDDDDGLRRDARDAVKRSGDAP